ncbi:MAG TPA: indolepyruvate ferredoxin oxidoreductase family protein [Baekduia sp.]|nr:indolepyruvate ferredoxin oxidoreductase family protein [Baekduia sp.]
MESQQHVGRIEGPAPPASTAPVKLSRPDVRLSDRYTLEQGTIFLTGVQALVRVLLDQHRADRRQGRTTGIFCSGYQGSPLGGLDQELARLGDLAAEHRLHLQPGLNEELGATAVYGTQLAPALPGFNVDGVVGAWYGKNPGLDRAMDALRHANFAGTSPAGGALAIVGDDPAAKSSTLPSAAEATLASLHLPVFFPGTVQEVLDLGLHAIACSRASGLWSALKVVTNVADAAATAQVWPDRVLPVLPQVQWEGRPYRHTPNGDLLGPASHELERTLFGVRLEIARRYAALNDLNPVTVAAPGAWLGIVAAGKVHYELVQALADVGLGQRELERAGIRLMRVGMLYPHDREGLRRFARGLDEVLVIEEKLPFLETAVRDALYGGPDQPRVLGKRDEDGLPLVPAELDLDADAVVGVLARVLEHRLELGEVAERARVVRERREALARPAAVPLLARTPFFCSGCPHNTSTANPEGTLVGAGIGCHTMVLLSPEGKGTITGLTQMGGEGAQFVGMAPFTDDRHFVQNVGDGTLHHSASLAIRFAVASGLNITYKVLYNQTVAMTGGQDVVGGLSVGDLCRELLLEGVARVAVTTEDIGRYKGADLPRGVTVHDRAQLAEVQAQLAQVEGVTVLVHDQGCAAEKRRMRKRGKLAEPAQRVLINERVCEGCGDCAKKSSCLSVVPVQTEFGRKTQIHQASCNKDFSCVQGDCPSFLQVVPAPGAKASRTPPALPVRLAEPALRVARDGFTVRMPGVGGTGVVTVSQVLQMAAMLDGRHTSSLDQTGLAQKGGPVVSDVRISRARLEGSNKATTATADLLLGFDLLGAAHPRNLLVADPGRTVAVVNTAEVPTAAMVTDTSVTFPALRRNLDAIRRQTRGDEAVFLDAQGLSEALFGDHLPTNTLLLGAAYQHGCLPVSADAIEQAIRLNGAAVDKNLAAFAWGRAVVQDPEAVWSALREPEPEPVLDATARKIVDATGATGELRRLLEVRVGELIAYQDAGLARRYAEEVMDVERVETERGTPGGTAVAEAFAAGLFKLLAVKDEYEVARLHLLQSERARVEREFGPGAKVSFLLHPPLLRAMGLQRKLRLGPWVRPAFGTLHRLRRLRGTRLDPFARAEVRRVERALPGEYRALMARALERLEPATHETVARIAALPDLVRGYEDVKLASVERFRAEAARLERELTGERFALPVVTS